MVQGIKKGGKEVRKTGYIKFLGVVDAKLYVQSDDYIKRRLNDINNDIQYWMEKYQVSHLLSEKALCSTMIQMYIHRYNWYLRKYR